MEEELKEKIERILRKEEIFTSNFFEYSPIEGEFKLRQEIARWLEQKWQQKIEAESIFITNNTIQSLFLLSQILLKEGDRILVEKPTYPGALDIFMQKGVEINEVPIDKTGICLELLQKQMIQKLPKVLYTIPTFQNPTGFVWEEKTREKVIQMVEEKGSFLLEDDPYSDIYFDKKAPQPLVLRSDRVIYLGTFSKILCPGLSVGYVILKDKSLQEHFCRLKKWIDPNGSRLTQKLVEICLAQGVVIEEIARKRRVYRENSVKIIEMLERNLGEKISYEKPQGGLFFLVELKVPREKWFHKEKEYPFCVLETKEKEENSKIRFNMAMKEEEQNELEKILMEMNQEMKKKEEAEWKKNLF